MTGNDMLARLIAQAEGEGADLMMIRALVEEASELGAQRAMERLGLADHGAQGDVKELRDLLKAWRAAKKSMRAAVIGWIVRVGAAMTLLGLAVKMNLLALIRA
jgi:hypothetical protein